MMTVVCSVPDPDPNSRMEGHRKLKFGSREAHDTGDSTPFTGQKVKVTKPFSSNFGTAACHLANTSNNDVLITCAP